MRYPLTLFLTLLLCTGVRAQIGLHPPRVDYQVIRAEHANVIFPRGYEARARRVASLIDAQQAGHTRSIGERIYPIDLILQTATTQINGYVGLAPFRSEFFTTPPQYPNLLSSADWVDLLTVHEYRHVQQNSNERRGVTRLFSFLQGQTAWAVLSSLAVPNWFTEGDAVIAETALTPMGRGATPAFSATLRSLLREGVNYRYAKARNGSLADLVPDHYRYGYNTLTYARSRFGNDVWRSVLHDAAAYKGIFYPFSRNLKKQTGLGTKAMYRAAVEELAADQDSFLAARAAFVAGEPFGPQRKGIVNYRWPQVDGSGRLLALRSSFSRTPELVAVDPAGRRDVVLTNVGIQREPYFHLRDNLAVWMETRQHPRYTNEVYSDVVLYDLDGKRKRVLTQEGKLFSPALSWDRQLIAAVYHDPTRGGPAIHLLASNTGERVERYPLESPSVAFPRFSPDGASLYFYDVGLDGVAIRALNRADGSVRTVRERRTEALGAYQVTAAGTLVFASGRDGIDNVYELDPASGREVQLTNVPVGAEYPHASVNNYLYYAEATPTGQRLRRHALATAKAGSALHPGLLTGLRPADVNPFQRPEAYAAERFPLTQLTVRDDYPVEDYNDKLGGVKLHSWSFNGSYVSPGVEVVASNALNTVALAVGGQYNINEERPVYGVSVRYGGWFPVVRLSAATRDRNFLTLDPAPDTVIFRRTDFDQQRLALDLSVPLQWVAGDFVTRLSPTAEVGYRFLGQNSSETLPDNFTDLGVGLNAAILRRQAPRHVQSRLGALLNTQFDTGLGADIGNRFQVLGSVFLPGLFANHGLRLDASLQSEPASNAFQFVDTYRYARGYGVVVNDRISGYAVNYQLPVLYPDFGILGLTYFRRVRLNAFYDVMNQRVDQFDFTRTYRSVGGQLFFDNAWLNTADITLGVQGAYLLDPFDGQQRVQFDLLFSGGF